MNIILYGLEKRLKINFFIIYKIYNKTMNVITRNFSKLIDRIPKKNITFSINDGIEFKTNNMPLGRWGITCSLDSKIRRSELATHDSCGGDSCETPDVLKKNEFTINNKNYLIIDDDIIEI